MKILEWMLLSVSVTPVLALGQAGGGQTNLRLVSLTILVKDYDEAARWYADHLGFQVEDNKDAWLGRRRITMATKDDPSFKIILHKPGDGYMDVGSSLTRDRIGKETFWILRTDDFDRIYDRLKSDKVKLHSEVRSLTNPAGKRIIFEDLYGNLWVLEQLSGAAQEPAKTPSLRLLFTTLLVGDYDEAVNWYSRVLGFQVQDNKESDPRKRWVMMNSPGSPGLRIIVHRPGDGYTGIDKRLGPERIGTETYWVLETPEFDAAHKRLIDAGVRFRSDVRTEPWAKEAAFEDLYGNIWVLQQPAMLNQFAPRQH